MARARVILGLLGTLAALALALWVIDWQALLGAFARLSPGVLLLSAFLSIVTTLILAVRWAVLTAGPRDRFGGQEFRDALVGQVFDLITRAALGSDAYRVVMAGSRDGGRTRAFAMLVLERLLGLGAYALTFLLAFAVSKGRFCKRDHERRCVVLPWRCSQLSSSRRAILRGTACACSLLRACARARSFG
jgi:uncharacterized membrane protein YbhN (UPF0104 family)